MLGKIRKYSALHSKSLAQNNHHAIVYGLPSLRKLYYTRISLLANLSVLFRLLPQYQKNSV